MKKIINSFSLVLIAGIFFTSCVKDRNVGPDFSSTQPVLELRTPISNIAGLANFGKTVIGNMADTVKFYANLASQYTMDKDINVTIGVDPDRIATYNSDASNTVKYELLPDSAFTILKTAGTIVKGQRIDSFQVVFYKDKIDPTHNYMAPIAILDGSGILLSSNQSVIWFHAIGNPLAGTYNWHFRRWNAGDTTGAPTYEYPDLVAAFSPDDPSTVEILTGYGYQIGGNVNYVLTFTDNGGVLSDFAVTLNDDGVSFLAANGINVTAYPVILLADAVTKHFTFYYQVTSSAPRSLIDDYYK